MPNATRPAPLLGACLFAATLTASAAPASPPILPLPDAIVDRATELRDNAVTQNRAYTIVESLTTEVGPRFAGSAGDRAAVAWALNKLKELGLRNVRAETVTVPQWVRGDISVAVIAPFPQQLAALALGGSIGTPEDGIEAPVVAAADIEQLKNLKPGDVQGKIVYFNGRMKRTRDGTGYGKAVRKRGYGAIEAAKLGAVGVLIRSAGTDNNRLPHTGAMRYEEGVRRIPAAALTNPDADLLDGQLATGRAVSVHMKLTSRYLPDATSANVIGEITGRTDEIVLLGAHLDSWDVGTGAHDDGAGVAIVTEAARLIGALREKPRRTLRVVLYANEEFGLSGAKAYAEMHAGELNKHVVAMEADFGAGRVWEFNSRVAPDALPLVRAIHQLLAPLDIAYGNNEGYGGADIGPLRNLGVPVLEPRQDGTLYFDLHHTDNDTLDKIDPEQLSQNVAVYTVAAYVAANVERDFGRLPVAEDEE